MANLLQKASIVLTPTAYNDGEVLCAKPDDGSGDFDFSRNSAATRVNAQGLVENVQILSGNLVQNGDFSEEGVQEVSNGSFSQEGVELITNGNFDTDSDWGLGTNWNISNGKANAVSSPNGERLEQFNLGQSINRPYKVTFSVSNLTQGSFKVWFGGVQSQTITSDGDYIIYLTPTTTAQIFIYTIGTTTGSIDNVSVREVGQDWTLGTGWSIGDDKAVCDGTINQGILQENIFTIGKIYKITFDVDVTSGTLSSRIRFKNDFSATTIANITASGSYTFYQEADRTGLQYTMLSDNTATSSITNISVKEVGQNWDLGSGWSIGEDKLTFDSNDIIGNPTQYSTASIDVNPFVIGKKYRVTLTDLEILGGNVEFKFGREYNTNPARPILTSADNGTYVDEFVAVSISDSFTINNGGVRTYGSIGSVSVIEITDDTNLPRINYEGFSYQDALGSELVTNGDFATDSDWNKTSAWSISGGTANCDGTQSVSTIIQNTTNSSGKYFIQFELKEYTQGIIGMSISGTGGQDITVSDGVLGVYNTIITTPSNNFLIEIKGNSNFIGSVDNVSVKEYLGQEVVPNSGCGSWLFEPQSTNLVPYSEDFSDSSWAGAQTNATVTASTNVNPSGNSGTYLVEYVTGNQLGVVTTVTAGLSYTGSFYVRNVSGSGAITLRDVNNVTTPFTATSEWQRFSVTGVASGAGRIYINILTTGDVIEVWGAQLEQQSYATSYIPTSGSTVTRNQDVCTNGGSLATINSTEGVLYAEIAALANDGVTRRLAISDGTSANRVFVAYDQFTNSIQFVVSSGGAVVVNQTFTISDVTQFSKLAIKYKLNDCSFWIDGIKVGTDTTATMPIGLNQVIFAQGDIARPFYGKTKCVAVWKEALSDEELADLTYPTPTDPTFTLDFDTIAEQFTFARGSEATYVDAQGLIKSTNELGEEEVINGDFENGSANWSLSSECEVVNSQARIYSSDGSFQYIQQSDVFDPSKQYKLEFDVISSNGAVLGFAGGIPDVSTNVLGKKTLYVSPSLSTLQIKRSSGITDVTIDNVSVKEVITATNTPRLDYSTGAEAFLLEPQSTNLIPYSEDFSDFSWIKNNAAITSNYSVSPSGDVSASRFLASSNAFLYDGFNVTIGAEYTISFWVKSNGSLNNFFLHVNGNNSPTFTATDVWQRFEHTFTAVNASHNIGIASNFSGADLQIWGAQLEQQDYVTSYIPTSGTTVTRNQETCINATPEINSEEGVLYADIAALSATGNNSNITLSDGTGNNRIYIYYLVDNSISVIYNVNSTGASLNNFSLANITDQTKIAVRWGNSNVSVWINGTSVLSNTTSNFLPNTLNVLNFSKPAGSGNFFGNTKDLQVYTKALSDAELIKLTT